MNANASTPTTGDIDSTIDDPARRRAILIAVCVALMAVIASVTGLNVAQPQLAVDFDATQSEVLWFINLYTMSLAALLLPLGALGDRLGRKPMLLVGLAIFGVSNITAGLASSSEIMLASRFVSGVGAAMIMPVTLAVITASFPDDERAKGIGVWTAVAGGGGILGMYLSALLVDIASWRWLFALPVALVVISAALIMRSVPNSQEVTEHRFDAVGSVTSVIAVLAIVFVLHEGPVYGWTEPLTLGAVVAGVIAVVVFVVWELRQKAPLLDLRLFGDRNLSSGSLTLLVVFGVQAGIFVVLFPFLQVVLGWSALRATLALMPMALTMMAASVLAPRLAARVGSRSTMVTGILLAGVGLVLMANMVSVDGGYLAVLPGMLAMGLGMGLGMTPSTEAITSALPRGRQGVASALNDVTREFGTALGVALLGAVLSAGYRRTIDPRLDEIPTDIANSAREGVTTAVVAADRAGERAQDLVRAAEESFVDGWQHAMWAGATVMALLLMYVLVRGPVMTSVAGTSSTITPTRQTPPAEASDDRVR